MRWGYRPDHSDAREGQQTGALTSARPQPTYSAPTHDNATKRFFWASTVSIELNSFICQLSNIWDHSRGETVRAVGSAISGLVDDKDNVRADPARRTWALRDRYRRCWWAGGGGRDWWVRIRHTGTHSEQRPDFGVLVALARHVDYVVTNEDGHAARIRPHLRSVAGALCQQAGLSGQKGGTRSRCAAGIPNCSSRSSHS